MELTDSDIHEPAAKRYFHRHYIAQVTQDMIRIAQEHRISVKRLHRLARVAP